MILLFLIISQLIMQQFAQIQKIVGLQSCINLKALVLNNNQIKEINGLQNCNYLTTIVFSNNQITEIKNLDNLKNLQKLQLSHNKISSIKNLSKLEKLKDLKLNDNLISKIPQELMKNRMIEILDLGKNQIKSLDQLNVIQELFRLKDLSVRNNPVLNDKVQFKELQEYVLNLNKKVYVLNNQYTDVNFKKNSKQIQAAEVSNENQKKDQSEQIKTNSDQNNKQPKSYLKKSEIQNENQKNDQSQYHKTNSDQKLDKNKKSKSFFKMSEVQNENQQNDQSQQHKTNGDQKLDKKQSFSKVIQKNNASFQTSNLQQKSKKSFQSVTTEVPNKKRTLDNLYKNEEKEKKKSEITFGEILKKQKLEQKFIKKSANVDQKAHSKK